MEVPERDQRLGPSALPFSADESSMLAFAMLLMRRNEVLGARRIHS